MRSRARQAGEKGSPTESALSISAGSWAVQHSTASAAFSASERYEVGTAAEAFQRTTGEEAGDNKIVFLGMPMTQRLNDKRAFGASLGTLGQAVVDAGGVTAAIGNADVGYVTSEQRKVRPAALAAMDSAGLVMAGDISAGLLHKNPDAPFGIETDLERFELELKNVAEVLSQSNGPGLVVLDVGDLYRAMWFRSQVAESIYEDHHARALTSLDKVAGLARREFPDATVIVVSQSLVDPEAGSIEGLGPIIVSGEGFSGYVTSNSTQRAGLVTNLDVTATVLDVFGLQRPVQVLGSPMRVDRSSAVLPDRIDVLSQMNDAALAVDTAKPGVVSIFVASTVLALALSALALLRSDAWGDRLWTGWTTALKAVLLFLLAVPVSSWVMFIIVPRPRAPEVAVAALLGVSAVVWCGLLLLWRTTSMRIPVAAACLATVAVLAVDQVFGAPASFTNFFGYSPLLGARFYGMGNEAAAIMFGAAVVGFAMLVDEWPDTKAARLAKRIGLPLLGILVVVSAAAPFLGANVAVAAWGLVGFGLAYMLMNGRRFSWRLLVGLFFAVAAVIMVFAAIDIFGSGAQTHLGRAILSAVDGGFDELWTIVTRKAEMNIRVLTRTNWSYILIATLAFLCLMRWRPRGDFADTLADNPAFSHAITVLLVAGAVAYFTEDSGIVIPALEFFYLGVGIAWLMLLRQGRMRHLASQDQMRIEDTF